MENITF